MTSPVFTPLQMFYSTSGLPLTDGYIYIGTASQNPQTNPIAVYWDAAGTIPAAQPIRTSGGYPVRNGSPATVFVLATDFSLIVRDKSSKLVFSRLSGNAFSAEWVTYTPAGTGAVATTVQAKLRESVSVFDFMTAAQIADVQAGALTIDLRAEILATFVAAKKTTGTRVYFPTGKYWLGSKSTYSFWFDLSGYGDNIDIEMGLDVEFVCNTGGGSTDYITPVIFYFAGNSHVHMGKFKASDTGYNPLSAGNRHGALAVAIDNSILDSNWGDYQFDGIYGNSLVSPLTVSGKGSGTTGGRIRGINVDVIWADNCYYGYNAADDGDGVEIGLLVAYQCYRSYFVYGVSGHKVNVFERNPRSTSGAINISRGVSLIPTSGIDVNYVLRDLAQNITVVNINNIDLNAGSITGIKINLDIKSNGTAYTPLRFINYTGVGGSETAAASSNVVHDITVSGSCDVNASACAVAATYASRGLLNFVCGKYLAFDNTVSSKFYLCADSEWITYTPTWSGTIGNGTITGRYRFVGRMCKTEITLTLGSTSVVNAGYQTITAPFIPLSDTLGSGYVLTNPAGTPTWYLLAPRLFSGSNLIYAHSNAATGNQGLLYNTTFTLASGTVIQYDLMFSPTTA